MNLTFDLIIGMAISSVVLVQVLTNFNSMIVWQKKHQSSIERVCVQVSLRELLRRDFSLAFDPTSELQKADKMLDQVQEKQRRKDDFGDGDDAKKDKESEKKESSGDDKKDKKKLPDPFTITYHEEKYLSKVFKSKIDLVKTVSFVSNNNIGSSSFQPCRVTYCLDQFQGKSDAKESLYKLYRLETTDLRTVPTAKIVKAQGIVLMDNILELYIQPLASKDLPLKFEKDDKFKNTKSLKEALEKDLKALQEENAKLEKEKKDVKTKGTSDSDKSKKEDNEKKHFARIYLFKIAYKEGGITQKIEFQVSVLSAKNLQPEKSATDKNEQEGKGKKNTPEQSGPGKVKPEAGSGGAVSEDGKTSGEDK